MAPPEASRILDGPDQEGSFEVTAATWQSFPITPIAGLEDLARFVRAVPIRDMGNVPDEAKERLRDAVIDTVYPICFHDVEAYLDNAGQQGQVFNPLIRRNVLSGRHKLGPGDGPTISDTMSDEDLLRALWRLAPAQARSWEGLSTEGARIVLHSASSGRQLVDVGKETLPVSDISGSSNLVRLFVPKELPESLMRPAGSSQLAGESFDREHLFADFTVYVRHQGKSQRTAPYTMRFWYSETNRRWHPVSLYCGLPIRTIAAAFLF